MHKYWIFDQTTLNYHYSNFPMMIIIYEWNITITFGDILKRNIEHDNVQMRGLCCVGRKRFSGVQGYGRPCSGSGGGRAWTPVNFRKFTKNSLRKLQNAVFPLILQRKFKILALNFLVFWRKTIDWGNFVKIWKFFDANSIENFNFCLFCGKFVAKNRAYGNNISFLQHFSGWGFHSLTPA